MDVKIVGDAVTVLPKITVFWDVTPV